MTSVNKIHDHQTCVLLAELFSELHVNEDQATELLLRFIARTIISVHDGDRLACKVHSTALAGDLRQAIDELRCEWLEIRGRVAEPSPYLL